MSNLITNMVMIGILMAVAAGQAGAETAPLAFGSVAVTADKIDRDEEKDIMQARGNVLVKWGGYTLLSDSVIVRQEDNEALAEGKVILRKEGVEFSSNRLKINYVTQLGEAEKGILVIKSLAAGKGVDGRKSNNYTLSAESQRTAESTEHHNFTIRGDRFLKTGQDDYRIERGSFTTCDGDSPSWKFTATDLDVKVDDYATGRNALLYVGSVPLFYTPYIMFPVTRERQSGFLFPVFGNSSKKGLNLDIPYYWAISPSQEITLDLDAQTKRGVGLGFDYRYLRPAESSGQVKGYIIYDTQKEWVRGYLNVKQQEALSPSLKLTADLQLSSDRDFYTDYGEVNGLYNQQLLDSTLFLTKNWVRSSLVFDTRYVKDLYADSNRQTLQKLPEVTYTLTRTPIGTTPIYFGLDSSVSNLYREDGVLGQRLDLHPTLTYYHTLTPGIDFSFWGGYRQRYYSDYGADENKRSGSRGAGLFDGGAALSVPLARVYPTGGSDLLAVRHTLIPELRYSLVEQKSQESLPFYDYKDRVPGQQFLTLSLTNFITGKYADASGTPDYRDMFYFRLSQGYQLSGSRRDELTQVDEGRRFTDIRIEARYTLAKHLTANVDSRYNPYQTRFSTASLRLNVDDGKGDLAGLGYQFAREQVQNVNGKVSDRDRVQYLEGKVALALVKPFVLKCTYRYSFEKKDFLETEYALEYKKQCWSLLVAYQDRLANKQLMISFTLAGIGSTGPVKAF